MRRRAQRRAPRYEQRAQSRRQRAQSHLARRQRDNRPATSPGMRRLQAAMVFCGAVALGLLLARPVWLRVSEGSPAAPVRVGTIAVQGHERLTADEIAAATGVSPGSELAAVDLQEVETRLAAHPWIARAQALGTPTGRLLVHVEERQPRAVVRHGHALHYVDAEGTPFAEVPKTPEPGDPPLPRLEAAAPLEPGVADARLAEAVTLSESLPERGIDAVEHLALPDANTPDEGWVLHRSQPPRVAVLGDASLDLRIDRLAALLRTELPAQQPGEQWERVDLRFEDRAVLKEGKPASR